MDKKFLNKVLDQIVNETTIDYDQEEIYFPFGFPSFDKTTIFTIDFHTTMDLFSVSSFYNPPLPSSSPSRPPLSSFSKHCIEVYGLNDDEIDYVWEEYRKIIIDKVESNG